MRVMGCILLLCLQQMSYADSASSQLQQWSQQAKKQSASFIGFEATRGQQFFTQLHGKEWRCTTCHTANPRQQGKHQVTGKLIKPMAPVVNPERFTDAAKTEKWFRRNCHDVLGRECTAQEKGDIVTWLLTLK
ncbi:DUF1924 domain-containing protein [Agitococcus lubricus]|uniref:Uncharacterized protein DUF1924 n=1 Tax=Agitococcus lubricus TaxID=1077255 RepID=A0A2T5J3U4_9GAMM|nr:DUF1924 domain-containing protein [Agitococcus lubricus]PTQ91287.1 uncharacterized protein DUF1924 [Agitococcus lubricus]